MRRKPVSGEFIKGLLGRLSAGDDTSNFHASVFRDVSEGIRARFRGFK